MDHDGKLPDDLIIPLHVDELGNFYTAIQAYDPPAIPAEGNA